MTRIVNSLAPDGGGGGRQGKTKIQKLRLELVRKKRSKENLMRNC